MSSRLLVVEDHFPLRLSLKAALTAAGFQVEAVGSAEEAAQAAATEAPEVVILDWNLPGQSGLDLLKDWRARGCRWPVILLTARDAIVDRVDGLEGGANDYLVKPFANEELVARINVQLRTLEAASRPGGGMDLSGIRIDLARRSVERDGESTHLTTKEAELLSYLSQRPSVIVERDELLREVWGYRASVQTRSADNTVLRLRAKIERDPSRPRHLHTVHGVGYRFEP